VSTGVYTEVIRATGVARPGKSLAGTTPPLQADIRSGGISGVESGGKAAGVSSSSFQVLPWTLERSLCKF